jgi:hypothetical protein
MSGKLIMTESLEAAVEAVKLACAKATAKRAFDPNRPATIRVDGSRNGFGASLEQDGHVIAVASRQKVGMSA